MSKIRINELARELEVKPNIILDLLPELGVADKESPSSSLDADVALAIRRRVQGESAHGPDEAAAAPEAAPEAPHPVARESAPAPVRTEAHPSQAPVKELDKELTT